MIRPWMLWAVGSLVAALALLAGIQTVRLADAKTNLSNEQAAHDRALAKASEEARATETGLRADLDKLQAKAAEEKEIAKTREDALVESVRDGNRRLSIRAVCPSGSGVRASASSGGGSGLQVAELDRQTGVNLVTIAIDGDRYIRERNACVEAYEKVRTRLNAVTP